MISQQKPAYQTNPPDFAHEQATKISVKSPRLSLKDCNQMKYKQKFLPGTFFVAKSPLIIIFQKN